MVTTTRGLAAALALSAALLAAPATARAHPALDEARGRYEHGDFEGALEVLDDLGDDAGLGVDDLVRSLELRVLAARALGDEAAADRALEALASLRPDHRFGREVPPVVATRFAAFVEASEPLAIEARADADGDHVVIRARAEHDAARLTRGVRLHAAVEGAWRTEPGPSLRLPLAPGAELAWFAELIGPGGAILRAAGSRARPRFFRAGSDGSSVEGASGVEAWPFLLAGGLAIAAGVAIAVALVLTAGVDTEVEGPVVPGFP